MFKGSYPALLTPMSGDGRVDYTAFEKFVDFQIAEGSHGIVPVGTTGESPTLTVSEQQDLIALAVNAASGKVPVVAGTGSNSTSKTVEMTHYAQSAGADGALVVAPYYNKPTQEGLFAHFKAVHDATDIPIILYNIPGRSIVDITTETMARLFELPRIVGVKDATGDLSRVAAQRRFVGADFLQMSGEDATAVGFNAMGGVGAISVTANVAPRLCADMQQATIDGDFGRALEIQDKLLPLHQALFCEPSPAPVKYAVSLLGLCSDSVRLPMLKLSSSGRDRVRAAMKVAGLIDRECA